MKKTILKALPLLVITIVVGTSMAALEGILNITMMKAIDYATLGNMVNFTETAKTLILVSLWLLPLNILFSYVRGLYKRKANISLKDSFLKGIFKKNINEFQGDNNSKYLSILTNDMTTIEVNYIEAVADLALSVIQFIVAFSVIAYINIYILIVGMLVSIGNSFLSVLISKPLAKHRKDRSDLFDGYAAYLKEALGAFHIIKANNLDSKIKADFYKKSKDIQEKGYVIDRISTYISSVNNFIITSTMIIVSGVAVYMGIKGYATLGAAIMVINNIGKVVNTLMRLSEYIPKIVSVKDLFEKMDSSLKNKDVYVETIEMTGFSDCIEFRDVEFSYEDNIVFSEVNTVINKGEKCLIIGPSGGGKSTILKLLRKYFRPNKGDILIDGNNLKDITKYSYFKNISNVEQQVFLFDDTVRNNITLYKDYSDEEIEYAIEKSGLRNFIQGLSDGLNTMIIDNGKNISGGERSRIAIARGLLSKSDIILLDEAFASLDSAVAKEIENTLLSLQGITVINVSHVIFEETKNRYNKVFIVKNKEVVNSVTT